MANSPSFFMMINFGATPKLNGCGLILLLASVGFYLVLFTLKEFKGINLITIVSYIHLITMSCCRYFKSRERDSAEIGEINFEEYIDAEDFIKANEHITHQGRICRIVMGYIIFVVVLGLSTIATFFLVAVSTSRVIEELDTSSVLVSAIIAVFMTMVNMVWKRICVWLTHLECHATWTKFRQHNTLKFFLFKMLNVLTMYASRVLVPRIS